MIQAAANAGARRRHEHDGHVEMPGPGPALIAGHLQQIDGVEAVVAELNLADRPAAGVGDAHGHADDAAFIERRIPGGLEPLRGREDAAQRRADVLAEDVGHAQVGFAIVQRQTNRLNESGHPMEFLCMFPSNSIV